jgi:hypothetical protein
MPTREQAVETIKAGVKAGTSIYKIQRELEEMGYVNPKTKRPLSYAGVEYMVKRIKGVNPRGRKTRTRPRHAPRTKGTSPGALLEMVRQILNWDLPEGGKVTALRQFLEHTK